MSAARPHPCVGIPPPSRDPANRAALAVEHQDLPLAQARSAFTKQEGARGAGTHQDTLKSATSSMRQPPIGQYACAGQGTIERTARGHGMNMITGDAYARRVSEPLEATATKIPRGTHRNLSCTRPRPHKDAMMLARANRGEHERRKQGRTKEGGTHQVSHCRPHAPTLATCPRFAHTHGRAGHGRREREKR